MSAETEKFSASLRKNPMQTVESVNAELSDHVRDMIGSEPKKVAWQRIARLTGLTAGQVKRLHYGEWSVVPAWVYVSVANAYRKHLQHLDALSAHQSAVYRARAEEYDRKWPNG